MIIFKTAMGGLSFHRRTSNIMDENTSPGNMASHGRRSQPTSKVYPFGDRRLVDNPEQIVFRLDVGKTVTFKALQSTLLYINYAIMSNITCLQNLR